MSLLKNIRVVQWFALLAIGVLLLGANAAHAQYTIVTPPNAGSQDGHSGISFTWTVPSPAPGATIGGYMQLNATAYSCCDTATIFVNGTPPASGASYSVGFWATAGATYNFVVTSAGGADVGLGWDFRPSPVNDNFANAIEVTTVPNPDASAAPNTAYVGSFTGAGSNATLETGDPMTSGDVWYKWTAPARGQVTWSFSSLGGGSGDMNIFSGTTLTDLKPTGNPFWTVAGATYYIAISRGGPFSLGWTFHPSPLNDNFANAVDLSAAPYNANGGSLNGNAGYDTVEPGDPFAQADVWYKWTAPATGVFSLSGTTPGGAGYFRSYAYRGTNLTNLINVGGTPDFGGTSFQAVAGTTYYLAVSAGDFSFTYSFQAAPTISSINPGSAIVGATIILTGTKFTGTTAVKFNDTAAAFTVVSDTQIKATVPTGATTGKISVTTPSGTATSATSFTVAVPPTLTSFTPAKAAPGASVTLVGTGFVGVTAVKFGTLGATTFTVLSPTAIRVTVPTGATTGKISVTTPGGTATSATSFTVIPPVRFIISGSINSGSAPLPGISGPVPNVPVFLVSRDKLLAVSALVANPALLASSASVVTRTTTNAAGQYTFHAVAGNYIVLPVLTGVYFTQSQATGTLPQSPYRAVAVTTADRTKQDFAGVGADNTAPTATITSALSTKVTGSAADSGSGVLTIVVTLQNASNQYLNWTGIGSTAQFTATATGSSYKLASATGSTTPLFNTVKVTSQGWSVTLPSNLGSGSYRVTVRAIDRAFRVGVPVTRVLTKGAAALAMATAGLSTAIASAATSSVTLKFLDALDAENASDAAHYSVLVNGVTVLAESAGYNASTHTVTLGLPEGALHSGDKVVASWQGLLNAQGQVLDGQANALSAH